MVGAIIGGAVLAVGLGSTVAYVLAWLSVLADERRDRTEKRL